MTTEEKLRAMEVRWTELSRDSGSLESPAWHAAVLRDRDERIAKGKEPSIDWEVAKRQLRERLRKQSNSRVGLPRLG